MRTSLILVRKFFFILSILFESNVLIFIQFSVLVHLKIIHFGS